MVNEIISKKKIKKIIIFIYIYVYSFPSFILTSVIRNAASSNESSCLIFSSLFIFCFSISLEHNVLRFNKLCFGITQDHFLLIAPELTLHIALSSSFEKFSSLINKSKCKFGASRFEWIQNGQETDFAYITTYNCI